MGQPAHPSTPKTNGHEAANLNVEALPKNIWFKKNCVSCNRHDMPFEGRNWSVCLGCTIDFRQFQIEGFGNPRNSKRSAASMQKLLDNYLELLQIYKFAEIWKEILSMEHYKLVTIKYEGKPEPRNFSGLALTQEGRKALSEVKQ